MRSVDAANDNVISGQGTTAISQAHPNPFSFSAYRLLQTACNSLDAIIKSQEILARGLGLFRNTLWGVSWRLFDDCLSDHRTRMSCSNVWHLMELENDLIRHQSARCADASNLLICQSIQTAEDALLPLWRGVDRGFGY